MPTPGNGRDENFFPVRSAADFDDLQDWLRDREFSDISHDEGFTDKHGKPLIGLFQTTRGGDGKIKATKRGIIWCKDATLRAEAVKIVQAFHKQT